MDASTAISGISAVVAVVAAGFSGWQADSARKQVDAATKQVRAAEEQVDIMRAQLAREIAADDRAAAPTFAVSAEIVDDSHGEPQARVRIKQTAGPHLARATVTLLPNDNVRYLSEAVSDQVEWVNLLPGSENEVTASLEYNFVQPVNVALTITAAEALTQDTDRPPRIWETPISACAERPAVPQAGPRRVGRRGAGF
ncbi:hypothetical protein [Streptomyces sp. NPDC057686]|uniref:hypothetical protein n=1 Tax=Streptomyces sp. NPDC057686 TaxID=3346212 RepID=UPI00369248E6